MSNLNIKIEEGISIPPYTFGGRHGPSKFLPLLTMKIGDSFFILDKKEINGIWAFSKKHKIKFSIRKVDGGFRIWRVA